MSESGSAQDAPEDEGRIAVIGMGIRLPAVDRDLDAFWAAVQKGEVLTGFFEREELLAAGVPADVLDRPGFVPARGVIEDSDCFDHLLFGYSPQDSALMDPQQRVLLECVWSALEHSGNPPVMPDGNRVGVYVGVGMNVYLLDNLWPNTRAVNAAGALQTLISSDKDFAATRIAYKLNLQGPALTLQSACSTSLVAVHLAAQSLLTFESDLALAGAATVMPPSRRGHIYEAGGILSPDGRCRPFDRAAQGTVLGDGAGIVVLKRYADAVRDGDTIHAVILGSAVNNDGSRKAGYTAPGPEGQAAVVADALGVAGIDPDLVGCVETHGTGTALGDPIELAALGRVFGPARPDRAPCALGAVKSVTGHLDTAAGVVGLIKTVLALRHRTLAPVAHFTAPNPALRLDETVFHIPAEAEEWLPIDGRRVAGVSSFGIGGTNAHVVLEQAPPPRAHSVSRAAELILVSAKTEQAAAELAVSIYEHVKATEPGEYADLAYTLRVGRVALPWRSAFVIGGRIPEPHVPRPPRKAAARGVQGLVFAVSGDGPQDGNRPNYDGDPVYRRVADQGYAWLRIQQGLDLAAMDRAERMLAATALIRSLHSRGVRPTDSVARGTGALAAACAAGVFPLSHGLALATRAVPATKVQAQEPDHPLHVGADGILLTADRAADASFWAETLAAGSEAPLNEVERTAAKVAKLDPVAWLEIGTRVEFRSQDAPARQPEDPHARLLFAVGLLWERGIGAAWDAEHAANRRRIPAPTYPFARVRHYIEAPR